ncbi:FtsX-like permease family protein [Clostridium sp.]|uniref:ABC transporter permease n=1 Tax=Clostridium sp. TaxID=1506 RepID=UPI0028455EFC|nr:FtsX-like permease family protein [Clostridium sp.]MDR3597952.1 FtsX-like permease family protein [Clostridium sp.]
MKNYSEISLRYMKQNKKRTTLTIMGIVLATILIFAIGTFLLSFRDAMIENIKHNDGDYEFRLNHLSSEEAEKVINNAEIKNSAIVRNDDSGYILKGKDDKDVYVNYVDKDYFKRMYTYKVIEGNTPTNSEEVIIDTYTEKNLKVEVGDALSLESKAGENKKFKIVGISEPKYYSGIVIYSYFDNSKLDKNYKYDVAVNLKSENNKQKIINNVISDANIKVNDNTKLDNSDLLYLTGNGRNAYDTAAIQNIIIFVLAVIMVSTIIVIFNSFNISVIERIRYFGILKAIGATPKQIMRIVFKEGFLMGSIAFPIGCIIGFISLKFGIKLFIGNQLMNLENFKVDFYPIVVLITLGLVAITIFLSLLGPAFKGKRVSAVDAMRNRNEIKIGKLKRRKGRIISKLFGVEGSIAYKNIRRTPFRFIVTVLALTISIIMFNVFYGFIDFAKQSVSQQFLNQAYEASLGENDAAETFSKDEIEELKNKNFLKNMFLYKKVDIDLIIENKFVNNDFAAKTKNNLDDETYKNLNYTKYDRISLISGKVENFKIIDKYIIDGKFDETALKNGGVILIEDCQIRNSAGKLETVNATNYKVGDKIKIPKLKSYAEFGSKEDKSISLKEWNNRRENEIKTAINNGEFYELPVIAIANKEPFSGSSSSRIGMIVNEDLSNTLLGNSDPTTIYFDYDNDKDREQAGEYFQSTKTSNKYRYDDSKESMDKFDQIYKQVSFFVYCFIIIITAISVVNIFNTISTNLLLRKKEFSTLKAIGMTEKQLKKSVMLEGTLYGIISAILGGIGSAILLAVLIRAGGGIVEIKYKFGVIPFLLSIVCAILVTYISTLAPLKRIEKLTIVEGISDEE